MPIEKERIVAQLNKLLAMELSGVTRYLFARTQILAETEHLEEGDKMLRGMPA